jgi:hypothetical protein
LFHAWVSFTQINKTLGGSFKSAFNNLKYFLKFLIERLIHAGGFPVGLLFFGTKFSVILKTKING